MAIPSSEPGKFKSAGSTGVQVDIGIGSNVFDAIAGTGKAFDNYQKERQRTLDGTAENKVAKSTRSLSQDIQVAIVEAGEKDNPDAWGDIANTVVEERRASNAEVSAKASKASKEAMDLHFQDTVNRINNELFLKGAQIDTDNHNISVIENVTDLSENAETREELMEALELVDQIKGTEGTKRKIAENMEDIWVAGEIESIETRLGEARDVESVEDLEAELESKGLPRKKLERLKDKLNSAKKILFTQNEGVILKKNQARSIEDGINVDGLDSLDEELREQFKKGEIGESTLEQGLLNNQKRRNAHNAANFKELSDQIKAWPKVMSLVARQEILDLADPRLGVIKDPGLHNLLVEAMTMTTGTTPADDPDISDLVSDLSSGDEITKSQQLAAEDIIRSKDVSMEGKMNVMYALLVAADDQITPYTTLESWLSLNEQTGELEWQVPHPDQTEQVGATSVLAGTNTKYDPLPLDDSQKLLIKLTSKKMKALMEPGFGTFTRSGRVAAQANWANAMISPDGAYEVYKAMHDKRMFEAFQGLSDKEAGELWREKFLGTNENPGLLQIHINNSLKRRHMERAKSLGVDLGL